ncbi:MAG: flagellar basal body L-ring protein FlgH [Pirellulales bacterium]
MKVSRRNLLKAVCCTLMAAGIGVPVVLAQSGSLYGTPEGRRPLALGDTSWYYLEQEPPRELRLNDLVTVVVIQSAQVLSEGDMQRTQRARYDAVLLDWIKMAGLSIKPATQPDGDPRIRATLNAQLQSNADLATRESIKFRIAARIVDIRPNGNIVLEAHQTIRNNNEVWEASLTGVARREDVLPDNTVLSQNVAELNIHKREKGHVRDAYKRGWFLRFIDYVRPF